MEWSTRRQSGTTHRRGHFWSFLERRDTKKALSLPFPPSRYLYSARKYYSPLFKIKKAEKRECVARCSPAPRSIIAIATARRCCYFRRRTSARRRILLPLLLLLHRRRAVSSNRVWNDCERRWRKKTRPCPTLFSERLCPGRTIRRRRRRTCAIRRFGNRSGSSARCLVARKIPSTRRLSRG